MNIDKTVIALAQKAYRVGAHDARSLCYLAARSVAMITEDPDLKAGAIRVSHEISLIDPTRAMPDFTQEASEALQNVEPFRDHTWKQERAAVARFIRSGKIIKGSKIAELLETLAVDLENGEHWPEGGKR